MPGQGLGTSNDGLRVPIEGQLLDRGIREGIGYRVSDLKPIQVPEQIVEILKLKVEMGGRQMQIASVFEEEDQGDSERKEVRADIAVRIFNYEVIGLVDTGSDITCISEELWKVLSAEYPEIPLMPVKAIQIKTAEGHKSAEIRTMVLIPVKLADITLDIGFLVVPNLSRAFILGIDWLTKHEIMISLKKGERGIWMEVGNEKLMVSFAEGNVEVETNNITAETEKNRVRNKYVKTGIIIKEEDRIRLDELLGKHKDLFQEKLGRANCYEHEIKMNAEVPIVRKSYPIPYAYRTKIKEKLRELESQGIISRSATPYCSPLTFTLKKMEIYGCYWMQEK